MLFFLAALGTLLVDKVWIASPAGSVSPAAPEVHSVTLAGGQLVVRSAGTSLAYLGLLQAAPRPAAGGARELVYRIPRAPRAATGRHAALPEEIAGVFVNGMPVYNQFAAQSYQGQNLWHFDPIAGADDGTLTAAGHPSAAREHPAAPGLLEALLADTGKHSPVIGFALDGYPIYGPWGFAHSDGSGGLRRMTSSYRLRPIRERISWADGTELTPGQAGPEVGREYPLGTFAEDYAYLAGAGDLDRYNGRFAVTPEYPQGTYAYFLAGDGAGRMAFPYLMAAEYYGEFGAASPALKPAGAKGNIELRTSELKAGVAATLQFTIAGRNGEPLRTLEYIHEKPIHVMVISSDLAEFDHIHPDLQADGTWRVEETFAHGGRYRIYAEYTTPGEDTRTVFFDVTVTGPARPATPLRPTPLVSLKLDGPLVTGKDIELRLMLHDSQTVARLEPYLGAWAHFAIVNQGMTAFIHAHPLAEGEAPMPPGCTMHTHTVASGPPPSEMRTVIRFDTPGTYKLWAQYQVAGRVVVSPFVFVVKR